MQHVAETTNVFNFTIDATYSDYRNFRMSLTSALRPTGLPFTSRINRNDIGSTTERSTRIPFYHEPTYLLLSRTLARQQHLILLTPSPDTTSTDESTPLQKKIQAELWSPLPLHRTKWLRNIEGARNLLLQLERAAQTIRVQSTKRDVVRDLSEKRAIIKKLRSRVEEIGREVESASEPQITVWNDEQEGETLWDYLMQHEKQNEKPAKQSDEERADDANLDQSSKNEETVSSPKDAQTQRDELFGASQTRRRKQAAAEVEKTAPDKAKTSGFSNLPETEQMLMSSSKEQEDITTSLVSMAAQLKQQARAFQFALDQDANLLDRAIQGLDQNVSAMNLASKGMNSLRRMSEEQGWLGRLKLYAMIFGLWIVAILLVFVGPKLRF